MSANQIIRATVLLNPGSLSQFQGVAELVKERSLPSWQMSQETVLDIRFPNNTFTNELDEIALVHAKCMPKVDVIVEHRETKPSLIKNGTILDWWPRLITVVGHMHVARLKEVLAYNVIGPEKRKQIEQENSIRKRLQDEPDLTRFTIIDWED